MYPPVPDRPKKPDIVRSRNGCKTCRQRRNKVCRNGIARLGRVCESVKPEFKFRTVKRFSSEPSSRVGNERKSDPSETGILPIDDGSLTTSQINVWNNVESSCRPPAAIQHDSVVTSTSYRMPSFSLMKSLQRLDMEIFYSTYWEDCCLPALHHPFRAASQLVDDFPALKAAILTLASCNIGRMQTERIVPTSIAGACTFRPNITHQTRSMVYYSYAIKSYARLSPQVNCHAQGLTRLFDIELRKTTSDPPSKALLAAWMQCRFHVWWARTYFSSLEVQLQQRPVLFPRALQGSFDNFHERRVAVLSILHWVSHIERDDWSDEDEIEEYCTLLAEEAKKLDDWFAHLPPSERPMNIALASDDLDQAHVPIEPFCRIMQCAGFVRLLCSRDPQHLGHECDEVRPWGTDTGISVRRNNYTIGFSGLLLAVLLRCQDVTLGTSIEKWLENLEEMQPTAPEAAGWRRVWSVTNN
ncbi:hypothetical protein V1525DRAFT_459610 [Lipomyces kononenkoae]|uniref:Uncharacterized protein n=1 Tax=Lipomyces kononenkoae TaxID=34357 RepID=A0ACC3SRJ8_LIPKO